MKVRCKFKCDSVEHFKDSDTVKLSAITQGSEENATFWKWTPSGQLTFNTINIEAATQFVPGREYYIDIDEA